MPLLHGIGAAFLGAATLFVPQDQASQSELEQLKKEVQQLQKTVDELKAKPAAAAPEKSALEKEFEQALGTKQEENAAPPPQSAAAQQRPLAGTSLLNPKISFDVLADGALFSRSEPQNFGGHDPTARGFSIPQAELSLQSAVDPFFNAEAHIIYTLREGETGLEMEEAFATTTSLPESLQLRAGTFFTRFGRQNAQHAHVWEFVTIPIAYSRFFGPDGFRNPGAELSWLAPTSLFLELSYTVQQADGENAISFLGESDTTLGGYAFRDRKIGGINDLAHTVRARVAEDFSDTLSGEGSLSAMLGDNATGSHNLTQIYGLAAYLKWKPLNAERGFPFVAWQTEYLTRFAAVGPDADAGLGTDRLHDYGMYSQLVWGFMTGWTTGLRGQLVNGTGGVGRDTDPFLDKRFRIGPNLTYYPSEFSKIRLEYDADFTESSHGGPDSAIVLQLEFAIGEHAAHTF